MNATRLGILVFSTALFTTLVALVHVSTLDVSFGTRFYAPARWPAGGRLPFRVQAHDPRGRLRTPAQITVRVGSAVPQMRVAPPWHHGTMTPDQRPNNRRWAELQVSVDTELGTERLEVEIPLDAPDRSENYTLAPLTSLRGQEGELTVLPLGAALVWGFENELVLWSMTKPGWTELKIAGRSVTAPTGVSHVRVTPKGLEHRVQANFYGKPFQRDLPAEARQSLLSSDTPLLQRGGQTMVLRGETLNTKDQLWIEAWHGGRCFWNTERPANGEPFTLNIDLPSPCEGLVRVTSYRRPEAATGTVSNVYRWCTDKPATEARAAVAAFLERHTDGPDIYRIRSAMEQEPEQSSSTLLGLLQQLKPANQVLPLLRDTWPRRAEEVRDRRAKLLARTQLLLLIELLIGATLVAWFTIRESRKRRQALIDNTAHDEKPLPGFTWQWEMVGAAGAIVLFAYALYQLMGGLRWE